MPLSQYTVASLASRQAGVIITAGLSLVLFWKPLIGLVKFSSEHEYASHIILIPIVSLCLIYMERKRIFRQARSSYYLGAVLLLAGALLYWLALRHSITLNANDSLSVMVFSIILVWAGIFALWFGTKVFLSALFPLTFLLLMIPIPTTLLDGTILLLQKGSTEISYLLFRLLGVPVFREGFQLTLPMVTIEVAKECSGIRSSLALLITCLLASYLFLRSGWNRTILVLLTIPLAIIKNAIRIVTLSLLGIYVNAGFLHGRLHRDGGILFFLLGLAILTPVLLVLQKSEEKQLGDVTSVIERDCSS